MGYLLLEALLCSLSSTAKVLLHLRMVLSRIFQTLMFEPRKFLSIFVMFIKIKETARNVELDDTCKSFFYNCLCESQYNHPNFTYMHFNIFPILHMIHLRWWTDIRFHSFLCKVCLCHLEVSFYWPKWSRLYLFAKGETYNFVDIVVRVQNVRFQGFCVVNICKNCMFKNWCN